MATFRLVDSGDFDARQAQFTFRTVGDRIYLQFGELSAGNRRLFESILEGGRVGFFEVGVAQTDDEAPNARIVDDYTSLGVEIDEIPDIAVGNDYEIKWTQARPGEAATPQVVNVLSNEGIVRITDSFSIVPGRETVLPFDYTVLSKVYESFRARFYPSAQAFGAGEELSEGDPRYPERISFDPPVPYRTAGFYVHNLTFIAPAAANGSQYLIAIDLIESETEEEVFDPADGVFLVDANGDWLVDANGDVLVEGTTDMWLVDANGDYLVDANGDWLVEG